MMMIMSLFGDVCHHYATVIVKENKFSLRDRKCIYLGNSLIQKGYVLYDLHNHTFSINRDVIFYEEFFSFKEDGDPHTLSSDNSNFTTTSPSEDQCDDDEYLASIIPIGLDTNNTHI